MYNKLMGNQVMEDEMLKLNFRKDYISLIIAHIGVEC